MNSRGRTALIRRLLREARTMLQGSLSATTRTCGYARCRCRRGKRHGPHTYLTFKTPEGRSSALYVPAAAAADARRGLAAWDRFWEAAVQLAAENREAARVRWKAARAKTQGGPAAGTR